MKTFIIVLLISLAANSYAHEKTVLDYVADQCIEELKEVPIENVTAYFADRGYVMTPQEAVQAAVLGCVAVNVSAIAQEFTDQRFGVKL